MQEFRPIGRNCQTSSGVSYAGCNYGTGVELESMGHSITEVTCNTDMQRLCIWLSMYILCTCRTRNT